MIYRILKNRNFRTMILGDVFLILASHYLSYYLRFDGRIPPEHMNSLGVSVAWIVLVKVVFLFIFDQYKGLWRYTSIHDLLNLAGACVASTATICILLLVIYQFVGFSRGVFGIDCVLAFIFLSGFRVGIRLYYSPLKTMRGSHFFKTKKVGLRRLLIIGAGYAGEKLLREIQDNPGLLYDVAGFIDDDPAKVNQTIHGAPIIGPLKNIHEIVNAYGVDEIFIAIPSASASRMRRIVDFCKDAGVRYRTLPGLSDLIEGKVSVSRLREVRYEDLLGRKEVNLEMNRIGGYLTGRTVLVTGGAGSIGSELCRQIATFNPGNLILVDQNESGLYEMEFDLTRDFPDLAMTVILAPIQSTTRMNKVFKELKPRVVFHAAAYKHVPMMELHPWEAVFNNINGSNTILELCCKYRVGLCVVVSTDKAVRPTNVMGATKRVVEKLMESYAEETGVRLMAVRFGNVLGSIGSVAPRFKKQIEAGGPVTVTHPDVTRYFMSIPEACKLILQAGAIGKGGEIFVLKMGVPVKIADMARDLITLSGYKPDVDIEIKFIGMRPGEKLYEELITHGEDIEKTRHEDILVLKENRHWNSEEMMEHIKSLVWLAYECDADGIKRKLIEIVPEYRPQLENDADDRPSHTAEAPVHPGDS